MQPRVQAFQYRGFQKSHDPLPSNEELNERPSTWRFLLGNTTLTLLEVLGRRQQNLLVYLQLEMSIFLFKLCG